MSDTKNVFWDSCVFYTLLTGLPPQYSADVLELLSDAKAGKVKIHCSTAVFAEIKQTALKLKGHASIADFFATLQSAVYPVDANPNIMIAAGELRGSVVIDPSDGKVSKRCVGLGDAIHLQTCLYLRDVMNVKDIVFQTFDNGKGSTWEGRCVPLLTFERWFPASARTSRVADVCGLTRRLPQSSAPNLFRAVHDASTVNPGISNQSGSTS